MRVTQAVPQARRLAVAVRRRIRAPCREHCPSRCDSISGLQTNESKRMNELKNLETLGLVLPSPAYIFGAILFGIIGYVAFRRGRKTSRATLTWAGVALMLYPYAIAQTWLLWAVGFALCGWIYAQWN